jgi:hypothetical protein
VDVVFSTQPSPPTVTGMTPASGAAGVSTNNPDITATFSEPVQSGTITFTLTDPSNNIVPATVSYNASTETATLTPNAPLATSTVYTVTLSGAQDFAGNAMTSPVSWSFTTGATPGAPSLITAGATVPITGGGAANVAPGAGAASGQDNTAAVDAILADWVSSQSSTKRRISSPIVGED